MALNNDYVAWVESEFDVPELHIQQIILKSC